MPASSTGRLPRLNRTKPVEMLSTREKTMLMAMSKAIAVRVRTEILDSFFISTVLLFFQELRGSRKKRPPL